MSNVSLTSEIDNNYTSVSNLFIEDYIPEANGDFVKIYLYLLHLYNKADSDISIGRLADVFNQTEGDIERALRYWDKMGLIKVRYFEGSKEISSILLKDIKRKNDTPSPDDRGDFFKPSYADTKLQKDADEVSHNLTDERVDDRSRNMPVSSSMEDNDRIIPISSAVKAKAAVPEKKQYSAVFMAELKKTEDFAMMLTAVERFLGISLGQNWLEQFTWFYDGLGMSAALIEYLVDYCVSADHRDLNYITKVALAWHEKNITTVDAAKFETSNHTSLVFGIAKIFGLESATLREDERNFLQRWINEYKLSADMILEACRKGVQDKRKDSFNYTNGILVNWHMSGYKTLEDVARGEEQFKNNRSRTVANKTNNKFNNFSQRPADEDEKDWMTLLGNYN